MENESQIYELGSISIFVNLDKDMETSIDEETISSVESQVLEHFNNWRSQDELFSSLVVTGVDTKRGCLITSVSIGVVVKAIGGLGALVIVYPKLSKGIRTMAQDIKDINIWRKNRKLKKKKAALYRCDLCEQISEETSDDQNT